MDYNWHNIRPLNGNKHAGFEHICAQLADSETPPEANFIRKGTPDGGVECHSVFPDGTEWGWQVKYVFELGDSQWGEIDSSVKTALDKHPQLVKYYICIPYDRPDARIGRQKSAMQKWNDHVDKWTEWASERNMSVEFIYWGSYELLNRLSQSKHIGIVRFWFDIKRFDQSWFNNRLGEAIESARPRYTPEINVELPIAYDFEIFGRTDYFFKETKAHAKVIRKQFRYFANSINVPVDSEIKVLKSEIELKVQDILDAISNIDYKPVGKLHFDEIIDKISFAEDSCKKIEPLLYDQEQIYNTELPKEERSNQFKVNPFRELGNYLFRVSSSLRNMRLVLQHAEKISEKNVMILKGDAGTGKTHLLCDVAQKRIKNGQPTILLMGQRFTSTDNPWTQIFQQLDLADLSSVEEFIGALKAAAFLANCRALVMIDAINEGKGRDIWPDNLAAFIARLEKSPLIGVVFSIRSSYYEIIIPENVCEKATTITHNGFSGNEYDAKRTFFLHYGIELPSTPFLAQEFHNPLYLKTLCKGLQELGQHRLPRGINGITSTFDLYLDAINKKIVNNLSFHPKRKLVQPSLKALAEKMAENGENWLKLDIAEKIVNYFLPGRDYDHSLYCSLVSDGVLVEDPIAGEKDQYKVYFAYERLADHIIVQHLLNKYLDYDKPDVAFSEGQPLSFLYDKCRYMPGLLEAFCIQIPELTGKEMLTLAPRIKDAYYISEAFRKSLIWRDITAFSDDTLTVLNQLIKTRRDLEDTLNVLIKVAALPDHPFNANYLDQLLRKYKMPDRDSWWSTYLHETWNNQGPVYKLVDWASSISPDSHIENEVLELCAITLSWMLTTSNRFLRDHATKALVNLLTEQPDVVIKLLERFNDIDDLYIKERIYAVAYGISMRSNDVNTVGKLAECAYNHIFINDSPPAHILLRDYARGVVERALHLNAKLNIVVENIRPPYKSKWPIIPTEEGIESLLPDWSKGSYDGRDLEWACNRISSSIISDDFARYVIGTNSSSGSRYWLSLKLDEPVWESPKERLDKLIEDFSPEEIAVWNNYLNAIKKSKYIPPLIRISVLGQDNNSTLENQSVDEEELGRKIEGAKKEVDSALSAMWPVLSPDHATSMKNILTAMENNEDNKPPRFDLREIQRYILWRVFDLGWTTERFGEFDRFSIGFDGRDAQKAERIGKKYQWIAYHEIIAYIADHYQFRDSDNAEYADRTYIGPWQMSLRDIDPSSTLCDSKGGALWEEHLAVWWTPHEYNEWDETSDPNEWVKIKNDLPSIDNFLVVSEPEKNGKKWFNVKCFLIWKQPGSPDQEMKDEEKREIYYICTGYLVKSKDVNKLIQWAKKVNIYNQSMPELPELYDLFLGEYGWSPAYKYFIKKYYLDIESEELEEEGICPIPLKPIHFEYSPRKGSFDCSVDEGYTLRLPTSEIIGGLDLKWSGNAANFLDKHEQIAIFEPVAQAEGQNSLFIREDLMEEFLAREKYSLCWIISGAKTVMGPGFDFNKYPRLLISGISILDGTKPKSVLNYELQEN